MPIQFKLNPSKPFGLPIAVCACGHQQTVYLGNYIQCIKCNKYFHLDSFKISRDVKYRTHYHDGGINYATGD